MKTDSQIETNGQANGLSSAACSLAMAFMLDRFPTEDIRGDQKRTDEWHTRFGMLLDFENFIQENAEGETRHHE
jgi:hypothetical protein